MADTQTHPGVKQAGFTLIEALIVLMITSVLMTIFSQMYLNAERNYARLNAYSEANRSAFYTRQQVRTWLSNITVPDDFGRTVSEFQSGPLVARFDTGEELVPFEGDATSMTGYLRDPLLSENEVRKFRLRFENDGAPVAGRLFGKVILEFDGDDEADTQEIVLGLHRQPIRSFAYIDQGGAIHDQWPAQNDKARQSRFAVRDYSSLEQALELSTIPKWRDLVPVGVLLRFGSDDAAVDLVVEIST